MVKIAICEDNADELKMISAAVARYLSAHSEWQAQSEAFSDAISFAEHWRETDGYDIALLDICMPGLSGMEIAREIRKRNDRTEIVFLTTSSEYAVDAFALKAAHYLLKPFVQEQFDEAMDRAMHRVQGQAPKSLVLYGKNNGLHRVDVRDIVYIESRGHAVTVYTKDAVLSEVRSLLTKLLEELEALSPKRFISPYKGYIINQEAVLTIDRQNIVLHGGAKIPIPQRKHKQLQDQYLDFVFANGPSGEVEP